MKMRTALTLCLIVLAAFSNVRAQEKPFDFTVVSPQVSLEQVLAFPRTQKIINDFCFEFRPRALLLAKRHEDILSHIAREIRTYNEYLSLNNQISCVVILDPGEGDGAQAIRKTGKPYFILIPYNDFSFAIHNPTCSVKPLLAIVYHETGHFVFHENFIVEPYRKFLDDRKFVFVQVSETLPYRHLAVASPLFSKEENREFFDLFTDQTYETYAPHPADKLYGHPRDHDGELFASAFMITLLYDKELEKKIAAASPNVREVAQELRDVMRAITVRLHKPNTVVMRAPCQ